MSKYEVHIAKCSCSPAHSPRAWVQSLPVFLPWGWPGQGPAKVQRSVLKPCWPRGPAVWHAADKQLQVMGTTNKNFPFPSLMCQVSLKRGTFWKESLKCLKIMCCIMEWPHQTPRREQTREMMHVGSSACVPSPSSWDVFKWGTNEQLILYIQKDETTL